MTIMRLQFAGTIMKCEHRQAGSKPICEVSLCKKKKGKDGEEDTYTWVRITLWEPKDFQASKLVKGNFIAGSGDAELRGYEKDGVKRQSLEVRCSSFDIEVTDGVPRTSAQQDTPTIAKAKERERVQTVPEDETIPF